jgi:hypothetical protein
MGIDNLRFPVPSAERIARQWLAVSSEVWPAPALQCFTEGTRSRTPPLEMHFSPSQQQARKQIFVILWASYIRRSLFGLA